MPAARDVDLSVVSVMPLNSITQRRRATTYGKVSRKPAPIMNDAFAKAAEVDGWTVEHDILAWGKDKTPIVQGTAGVTKSYSGTGISNRNTKSSTLHGPLLSSIELANQNHSSVPTAQCITEYQDLYDVYSSENEGHEGPTTHCSIPRKRRRFSREAIVNDSLPVYDDAGLQRHIAAQSQLDRDRSSSTPEARVDGEMVLPQCVSNKTPNSTRLRDGEVENKNDNEQPHGKHKIPRDKVRTVGMLESNQIKPFPSIQGLVTDSSMLKRSRNVHSSIPQNPETPTILKSSVVLSSSTPPVWGDQGDTPVPEKEAHLPITLPKPTKYLEDTITPRQQQLWNKLLFTDSSKDSPHTLKLQDVESGFNDMRNTHERATECENTRADSEGGALTPPRRRIVDTLHPFDCLRKLSGYSGEGIRLGGPDNSSDSGRSNASITNDVITFQTSQSADSQDRSGVSSHPQPMLSLHGTGSKITYAYQRSYLTDNDLDGIQLLSLSTEPVSANAKGSGRTVLADQHCGLDSRKALKEKVKDSPRLQGGAMRSIHELREAGGNVRLKLEIDAILDDIENEQFTSNNIRRNALSDLVRKLQEPTVCHFFVDQGFESRLLAYVSVRKDIISDSFFATIILQLLATPDSMLSLPQMSDPQTISFLVSLLGLDQNLESEVKVRHHNLPPYAQQEYCRLYASLSRSPCWRRMKPPTLSCHVLALQCLEYLVRQTRVSGFLSELLSTRAIRRIIASSLPRTSSPLPQKTASLAISVELAISILESCTIIKSTGFKETPWNGETLQRVIALLPLFDWWRDELYAFSRTMTLRLYVNLTNNSPQLCEEFSTPGVVKAVAKMIIANFECLSGHVTKDQRPLLLDDLILSLGALINLAESCKKVRRLIMDTQYQDCSFLAMLFRLFMSTSKTAGNVRSFLHHQFNERR